MLDNVAKPSTPTDICSSGSCVLYVPAGRCSVSQAPCAWDQNCPTPQTCVFSSLPNPRFVANGDGTVTDLKTCVVWEKKTGIVGTGVTCIPPTTCPDPHAVNNQYQWSSSVTDADGGAFTDFLVNLNGAQFAGRTDWRLPSEDGRNSPFTGPKELESILLAPDPCGTSPCINVIFGPTAPGVYWSSSTSGDPAHAWDVSFSNGAVSSCSTGGVNYVRAVRGGP